MNTKTLIYTILAFGLPVLLLWFLNFPKRERYRQYWAPRTALALAVVVLFISNLYLDLIREPLGKYLSFLHLTDRPSFPVYVNWAVLIIFLIIKTVVNGTARLAASFQKLWSIVRSKLSGKPVEQVTPVREKGPPAKVPPAYEYVPGQGVMLRRSWFFPGDALLLFAIFSVVLLIIFVIAPDTLFSIPYLPVISVLLLCETAWYLQGMRSGLTGVSADSIDISTANFSDIWETYQKIWGDRVIVAAQISCSAEAGHPETLNEISELFGRNENVLIPANDHSPILRQLFAHLLQSLIDGKKIIVLVGGQRDLKAQYSELVKLLVDNLATVSVAKANWKIQEYDQLVRGNQSSDILLATPELLASNHYIALDNDWFSQVRLVLVPEASMTFSHLSEVNTILHILADKHLHSVQMLMLSDCRQFTETALRYNFGVEMKEKVFKNPLPPQMQIIIWKREGGASFQNYISRRDSSKYLGAEAVLSTLAWCYKMNPILQINQDALPYYQRTEELQNHLNEGFFHIFSDKKFDGVATEPGVFAYRHVPWGYFTQKTSCVVACDSNSNLTSVLGQSLGKATNSVFVNVVSSPYVLRDYLASNIEYFRSHPLLPLAPRISTSPYTIAIGLMARMVRAEINGNDLLFLLREVDMTIVNVKDGLCRLFLKIFGVDILTRNLLRPERKFFSFDVRDKVFHDEGTTYYSLAPEIFDVVGNLLSWMTTYKLVDKRSGMVMGEISADHLYQTYLPGQVHAFKGNPYCIRNVDSQMNQVNMDFQHNNADYIYRADVEFVFPEQKALIPILAKNEILKTCAIRSEIYEMKLKVATPGYFSFANEVGLDDLINTYVSLSGTAAIPVRQYNHARVLKISFTSANVPENVTRIAFTISTILNEMFVTLFPETCHFISAGTIIADVNTFFSSTPALAQLMPSFTFDQSFFVENSTADSEEQVLRSSFSALHDDKVKEVVILFAEDSHYDMGLIQCLFDDWRFMFDLLYDYLVWLESGETLSKEEMWRKRGIANYEYLCFGIDHVPEEFDITGTLGFLDLIGFGEEDNSIGAQRRSFYSGDKDFAGLSLNPDVTITSVESQSTSVEFGERGGSLHQCDFCGRTVPAKEMQLIDGLLERCQECGEKAVSDFSELVAIYNEARLFLENDLRLSVRDNVHMRFASTATIQEESGVHFIPTSRLDPRALGVAIHEGENRTILVENGSPHYSILATTVHELTHIWQYDFLDFVRMKDEHGLLLTEGQAMWAEIECLTRKKLAPELCSHEKSRSDVYGQGYRAILQMLNKNPKYQNPFELLFDMYRK